MVTIKGPWSIKREPLDLTKKLETNKSVGQPTRVSTNLVPRETLVGSGHVSPRIWDITNKQFGGGADKCEICLYKA